ncbi:MAG: hypothetical protein GY819_11770 [Planctomycetaceae bacterium]|nr:hypothetical protein [Planctomycetaceae bacterium]
MDSKTGGGDPPIAILVNGGSSSGKSTLCRALQARLIELADGAAESSFASVAFDDFLLMISPKHYPISFVEAQGGDTSELVSRSFNDGRAAWEYLEDRPAADAYEGKPYLRLELSSWGRQILRGVHESWGLHLQLGTHLIIDHFLQNEDWCAEVLRVLRGVEARTFLVGVFCDVDEMERREAYRSDGSVEGRPLGLARRSADLCHAHELKYDVQIHTDRQTTGEAVDLIMAAFEKATDLAS